MTRATPLSATHPPWGLDNCLQLKLQHTGKEVLACLGRTLAQAALRFALDNPAVSVVIAGAKTEAEVQENRAASGLPTLTAAERDAVPF